MENNAWRNRSGSEACRPRKACPSVILFIPVIHLSVFLKVFLVVLDLPIHRHPHLPDLLDQTLLALFAQSTPWKIGAGGRGHEGGGLDRGN